MRLDESNNPLTPHPNPFCDSLRSSQLDKFSDPIYNSVLNQHESVGILLRMARVDPKSTGNIIPEEDAEFVRSMMTLIDEIVNFFSTAMVINTLKLANSIPHSLHEITIPPFESATLGGTEADPNKNNGGLAFYIKHFQNPIGRREEQATAIYIS